MVSDGFQQNRRAKKNPNTAAELTTHGEQSTQATPYKLCKFLEKETFEIYYL